MSILLIVGLKCTLAVSHAVPGESRWVCRRDRQTDRRTDARLLHYAFRYDRSQRSKRLMPCTKVCPYKRKIIF